MPQNFMFSFLLAGDELSNKEEALQKAYAAVLQHLYLMYFEHALEIDMMTILLFNFLGISTTHL